MGTRFLWDPVEDNIVKELDDAGATVADYTTAPLLYGDLISQHCDGQSHFYHFGGQGSTTELTDSSGNTTDTRRYSAFGETTESTGSTDFPFKYVGQKGYYRDSLTGQYFARRRPYDATRARWMSQDLPWLRPSDLYIYAYCHNRPLTAC
jgi:RHS repeat-associated protein